MKRALFSKNKHKFVDKSIPVPQSGLFLHDVWERCNMMVISWITKTVNTQIAQSIVYIENARELWEDL